MEKKIKVKNKKINMFEEIKEDTNKLLNKFPRE